MSDPETGDLVLRANGTGSTETSKIRFEGQVGLLNVQVITVNGNLLTLGGNYTSIDLGKSMVIVILCPPFLTIPESRALLC